MVQQKGFSDFLINIKQFTTDKAVITDLIVKALLTFGVVLIVDGLYLMLTAQGGPLQIETGTIQSLISTISWVPGIPFNIDELTNYSASTVGLVTWIIGIDLFLIGLGFWVRNRLARWVGLTVFFLATAFQFVKLLSVGVLGAPLSVAELAIDGTLFYLILSRFDSK